MKNFISTIIIGLFIGIYCHAQDSLYLTDGTFIDGSVIIIQKAKVYFEDSDTGRRKWQKKIDRLIDDTDGEKIEYRVRDIKGLSGVLSGELISGKASYYVIQKYNAAARSYMQTYYVHKEGGKLMKDLPNSLTSPYKKRMAKYFSDCPILVNKINADAYDYKTTEKLIEFYNSNCGK